MLPGVATTPAVFLHQLRQEEENIEHIISVVQYKDGHTETFWTKMTRGNKVWMKHVFNEEIDEALRTP